MGLVNIKNFVFDGKEEWEMEGTIYDPKNGKTYSCYIQFESPKSFKDTRLYWFIPLDAIRTGLKPPHRWM